MVTLSGLLLGVLDIVVVVLVLVLVGALVVWGARILLQTDIPWNIQRLYLAIVGVIALIMLVSLLLGFPRYRIFADAPPIGGRLAATPNIMTP